MTNETALRCPKDQSPMRTYERNGVTIDHCTECVGISLNRGELERLIDAEGRYNDARGWRADERGRRDDERYWTDRRPARLRLSARARVVATLPDTSSPAPRLVIALASR